MGPLIDPLSEQARLLQQVIGSTADLIFLKNRAGEYIASNEAYSRSLFNLSPGELLGHGIELYGNPEITREVRALDEEIFDTGTATREEGPRLGADGMTRWYDVTKTPLFDSDGIVAGMVGIARDITRQHMIESRLENQNEWLENLNDATIGMIRAPEHPVDIDCLVRSISKLTEASYVAIFLEPHLDESEQNSELVLRAETGESGLTAEKLRQLAEQAWLAQSVQVLDEHHMHAVPINAEDTRSGILLSQWGPPPTDEALALSWTVARQLGVLMLNKALVDDAKYRATHDELTGLCNRRQLTHELNAALSQQSVDGLPVAVIFADLDGFKIVNDTWGHHRGDLLLQLVAKRLKRTVRATDTLARLGGDEFAFVIPNGNRAICAGFLDRVSKAIEEPFDIDVDELVTVGLSAGFAQTPEDGMTATDLMIAADKAMYANKPSRQTVR